VPAELGLTVAGQATGHNAAPMGDLGGTILLSTRRMREVSVDAVTMIARVDAGAIWGDVTPVAGAKGLAALAGSSHDVGIVGYTLGGGISWFARSHGLASSSVTDVSNEGSDRGERIVPEVTAELGDSVLGGRGGVDQAALSREYKHRWPLITHHDQLGHPSHHARAQADGQELTDRIDELGFIRGESAGATDAADAVDRERPQVAASARATPRNSCSAPSSGRTTSVKRALRCGSPPVSVRRMLAPTSRRAKSANCEKSSLAYS